MRPFSWLLYSVLIPSYILTAVGVRDRPQTLQSDEMATLWSAKAFDMGNSLCAGGPASRSIKSSLLPDPAQYVHVQAHPTLAFSTGWQNG